MNLNYNVSGGDRVIATQQSRGGVVNFQLNYTGLVGTDHKIEVWGSVDGSTFEKIAGADKAIAAGSGSALITLSNTGNLFLRYKFVKGADNSGVLNGYFL